MAFTPGQEKCIHTLDRSLVVAAGAGSGKTFTLTKRIVHAIESGAVDGMDRVCAITFTNKAAGELKSRIKAELRSCGLTEQALAVDEAWVSTIHGMCARILRSHAVELDLDPSFKMIDPADAAILQGRAVEDVLVRAQAADLEFECEAGVAQQAVDSLFKEYPARSQGPRASSVESMLGTLMGIAGSRPSGFDRFTVERSHVNPASLVDIVAQTYEALVEATLAQKPTESREMWVACVREQLEAIRAGIQENAADALWALHVLDELPLPKRVGTADFKALASQAITLHQTCVMELRLAAAAPHLETLVALARAAQSRYDQAKRTSGVLDNDDLLVLAYDAVANHPEIAALYADRFQLVMVDEFQDTDQMQVDMIKRIAGPGACRLCTVGDAQQSIYRFRGADVAVYRKHLEGVRAGDPNDVILLPDNFRSHPDVLSLVDRVFERPEMFGAQFMSLSAGRDESRVKRPFVSGSPRVQVQLTSNAYRGVSADVVRQTAAARMADALADLHARGHSAGEMAVLLGGMTHAGVYAAALRSRGLACVISGGSVFAGTSEAQLVGDLVRIAANPRQTQSLHNVLVSPMFELCAGDLLELATYVADDGEYRRGNLAQGLTVAVRKLRDGETPASWSPRLVLAVRVMGDYLAAVGHSDVSRCVSRAVADSGLLSRLQTAGPEGLARCANAYKAIRIVEGIESTSAAGPARVARAYDAALAESKEAPGALSSTGGDFVRIMTVHASKGLEFPIVAVAEFREASGPTSKLLTGEAGGRMYLSLDLGNTVASFKGSAKVDKLSDLYAAMTEGCVDEDDLERAVEHADGALARRAALYERELVGDEEEAKRLLYVALTRAKEALIVSLAGRRTKDNPNATPKSCLGAVTEALAGQEGFAQGISQLGFGGSIPAFVEHVALEAADEDSVPDTESVGADDASEEGESAPFMVPAPEVRLSMRRTPVSHAHEGVFSYSSIADASHEGDLLERLARCYLVSVDAFDRSSSDNRDSRSIDTSALHHLEPDEHSSRYAFPDLQDGGVAFADEDDDSWGYTGMLSADSDKATDLGTAFHRLAQYAVATRGSGALVRPSLSRIEALARSCMLDDVQRERLEAALDRWFASGVAAEMAQFDDLRAEVPFFVKVPSAGQLDAESFMEGEIDLLGLDDDGGRAVVVDYKTGGHDDETADALAEKHVLQAACYAYAIMLQGVLSVDAVFVRVERARDDDPSQPQCVRYHFEAQDLPALEAVIVEAHANKEGSSLCSHA